MSSSISNHSPSKELLLIEKISFLYNGFFCLNKFKKFCHNLNININII